MMRMPSLVDESVLAQIEIELRRSQPGLVAVLDFTLVRHVRYRDLQRFARAVRETGRWSVRLVGLSGYCREIFRFALLPSDWEVFCEVEQEWPAAAWRSTARRGRTRGFPRVLSAGDGFPGGLPVPSPN